jgi:hypothetical protein
MSVTETIPSSDGDGGESGESQEGYEIESTEKTSQIEEAALIGMENFLSENPTKAPVVSEAIEFIYKNGGLDGFPDDKKQEFFGALAGLASTLIPMAVKGISNAVSSGAGKQIINKLPIVGKALNIAKGAIAARPGNVVGQLKIGTKSYKVIE